jgi:hypothetical protein
MIKTTAGDDERGFGLPRNELLFAEPSLKYVDNCGIELRFDFGTLSSRRILWSRLISGNRATVSVGLQELKNNESDVKVIDFWNFRLN